MFHHIYKYCVFTKQIYNEKGDILKDTWSNAFRRLGVIGRIGFTRHVLDKIILNVFGNNMWDYAPAEESYGENYIIKY